MQTTFSGFAPDAFAFFRELARNNSKAWFDRNRERYEACVVAPFRTLLTALTPVVLKLDPDFEVGGKTNRNFSRINRDIRFHKDRAPYHTNYYLYFFDRARKRMDAGRLYVGLSGDALTTGFSIYGDRGSLLDRVAKPRAGSHSAELGKFIRSLGQRYESYWYKLEKGEWAKVAGFPQSDDWRRVKGWVVRKALPASRARGGSVRQHLARIFTELYPLYLFTSMDDPGWAAAWRRAIRKRGKHQVVT